MSTTNEKLEQVLGPKQSKYDRVFRFSGGYEKDGNQIPVDHKTIIVDLKSICRYVGHSKKGNAFAMMDTRELIELADELPKLVDQLIKEITG